MAVLTDLPTELLEQIFHFLGSIDDVHYLGRAFKRASSILQSQNAYLEIMRSIISRNSQYRYDIILCKLLRLHGEVVLDKQAFPLPFSVAPLTTSRSYTLSEWDQALELATTQSECEDARCILCIPDEAVYDILARYQGLRVFENIWLKRQLGPADFMAVDCTGKPERMVRKYQHLVERYFEAEEGDLPLRNPKTPQTSTYNSFNPDQRGRFHSAIVYVWILNEIRWFFTNFAYPADFTVQVCLIERCKERIDCYRETPFVDELDQYAVYKFLYQHLVCLYGINLVDRPSAYLPFTFPQSFEQDPFHSARLLQHFFTSTQAYFQPPDLIDLISRSAITRRPPWPLLAFPESTEIYRRPLDIPSFPQGVSMIWPPSHVALLDNATIQLDIIQRASFHQSIFQMSPPVATPPRNRFFDIRDDAEFHYHDRASTEFELHESKKSGLTNVRKIFNSIWEDKLWSVWWWAGGEDKTRALVERWREGRV